MIVKLAPEQVYPAVKARFPHKVVPVITSAMDWDDPMDWCVERWGGAALMEYPATPNRYPKTWVLLPSCTWTRASGTYYFENHDHAFEFKMRWG